MKQTRMESLMERFREGELSDAERAELEALAHKDEVVAAAEGRARSVWRRRAAVVTAVVAMGCAGGWLLTPRAVPATMVAEARPAAAPAAAGQGELLPQTAAMADAAPAKRQRQGRPRPAASVATQACQAPAQPLAAPTATAPAADDDPVVMCNNQCDADSVISDIRRFLSV